MGSRVEIDLLGLFRLARAGETVPPTAFGGRQARLLLRVLTVVRGTLVTREALIEVLWPHSSPSDTHANLNVLTCRVRRALGDPSLIETAAGGYMLRGGPDVSVDAERFETAVGAAVAAWQRADAPATLHEVGAALELWRGDPLPEDAFAAWAASHRERWARARADALELGAAAALAAHEYLRAVRYAREAARSDPLREPARVLLARSLAASGDRATALCEIEQLRRDLAGELGIDLGAEAQDLRLRLVRGAPEPAGGHRRRPVAAPFVGR